MKKWKIYIWYISWLPVKMLIWHLAVLTLWLYTITTKGLKKGLKTPAQQTNFNSVKVISVLWTTHIWKSTTCDVKRKMWNSFLLLWHPLLKSLPNEQAGISSLYLSHCTALFPCKCQSVWNHLVIGQFRRRYFLKHYRPCEPSEHTECSCILLV